MPPRHLKNKVMEVGTHWSENTNKTTVPWPPYNWKYCALATEIYLNAIIAIKRSKAKLTKKPFLVFLLSDVGKKIIQLEEEKR